MTQTTCCEGGLTPKDTFRGVTRNLASDTCMHGLPNVIRAENTFRKCLWVLITLAGTGMMIWSIQDVIVKYYSYPTATTVTIQYDSALNFPMVTICNLNPIRKASAYMAGAELQGLFGFSNGNFSEITIPGQGGGSAESGVSVEDWDELTNDTAYFSDESSNHKAKFDFYYYINLLNDSTRANIGHNHSWMLLSCEFNGFKCSPSNFSHFLNYQYGNCYSFNTGFTTGVMSTSKPGPLYGLTLELYIEHGEYISEITDTAGIKLVISNQSDMPFPQDEGYILAPGTKTSLAVTKLTVSRAGYPYGSCENVTNAENLKRNLYAEEKELLLDYSDRACHKTCYQIHVVRECRCCDSTHPCFGTAITDRFKDAPFMWCNVSDDVKTECLERVEAEYQAGKLHCIDDCPPPCVENYFQSEVSSGLWPSAPSINNIARKMMSKDHTLNKRIQGMDDDEISEFVWRNALKVEVYYQKLNYERISTASSYGLGDLLADMGGAVGLWVGLSVVTLFEFIEYMVNLCILAVIKMQHKNEIRSTDGKSQLARECKE